ncbi:MAG: FkbM family methyltransferase [Alphaproteobacteria bacterium]|nr:FkbM family methyltransferase [Alphaproteobacteria bacterium]
MTVHTPDPPFGQCKPARFAHAALMLSRRTGEGRLASLVRSLCYRLARGRSGGPFDLTIFSGQSARLYSAGNLCEKRVFTSDRHWDVPERRLIDRAAAEAVSAFHFVDVGANVGLYSLYARSAAAVAGIPFRAVAIEPQPEMLRRLRFNIDASGARNEIVVCPWAVTGSPQVVHIDVDASNFGTGRIVDHGGGSTIEVAGRPLTDALDEAGLDRIDVLKIDIEGAELPALESFFASAPRERWPRYIIIEAGKLSLDQPAITLCLDHGYAIIGRGRLNAMLALA